MLEKEIYPNKYLVFRIRNDESFSRGHTSGLYVPTFIIDVPFGGGKIPLHPI